VQLAIDGNAANDEAVLQWGRGLGAPFLLANNDLVFECRLVSAITAAKHSWAIGWLTLLLEQRTACLLILLVFLLLPLRSAGLLTCRRKVLMLTVLSKPPANLQDGATKTKLNALTTWSLAPTLSLGFDTEQLQNCRVLVNGVLAGTGSAPARLTSSEINAATSQMMFFWLRSSASRTSVATPR
jgi:hypothetical protein